MLELTFDIEPDQYGIVNGVELAGQMIEYSAVLLAAYVNSCPGCLDNIFSAVANRSLEHLHTQIHDGRRFLGLLHVGDDAEGSHAAHLALMEPLVLSLLNSSPEEEEHQH